MGVTPPNADREESKGRSGSENARHEEIGCPSSAGHMTTVQEQQLLPQASGLQPTAGVSFSPTDAITSLDSQETSYQPLPNPFVEGSFAQATGTQDGGQLAQQRGKAQPHVFSFNYFGNQDFVNVFLSTENLASQQDMAA